MSTTASIRATSESGQTCDDPDEDTLYALLGELNLRYRFLVVERRDQPQHYVQVCLEADSSCLVEYRDGGPHAHCQARIPAPYAMRGHDLTAAVVKSWARDDDSWRTALPWLPLGS